MFVDYYVIVFLVSKHVGKLQKRSSNPREGSGSAFAFTQRNTSADLWSLPPALPPWNGNMNKENRRSRNQEADCCTPVRLRHRKMTPCIGQRWGNHANAPLYLAFSSKACAHIIPLYTVTVVSIVSSIIPITPISYGSFSCIFHYPNVLQCTIVVSIVFSIIPILPRYTIVVSISSPKPIY